MIHLCVFILIGHVARQNKGEERKKKKNEKNLLLLDLLADENSISPIYPHDINSI